MAKRKKKAARPVRNSRTGWEVVNRIQLAKLMGVHPDTVSDYSRSGMPVITRGGAGRESAYDAIECLGWWRSQQGKNAKEAAQTRQYESQTKLNELKLAIQKGELIRREDVILAGQSYTKAWTAKIRALPRHMVQGGLIPKEREQQVTILLHALLTEISQWKKLPA
jgi:phage terminase Nu1 subunit (DNA packaging protein)